jgi:hypothetical protein
MAKDDNIDKLETVLVIQGGGSLGAYECGVYKALSRHGKKLDIVAGTSIGAINAAIITSSIADDNPSKRLEDFWLTLAQSIGSPIPFSLSDKNRAILSTTFSATWGNPNAFVPNWDCPENLKFPIFGLNLKFHHVINCNFIRPYYRAYRQLSFRLVGTILKLKVFHHVE